MPPDRERELRKAIKTASLTPRDFRVFTALLDRADWKSAVIPNRFQPRNIDALANEAGLGARSVNRALDHLEMHGWVKRAKGSAPGRHGRAVAYVLERGETCACQPERRAPMTGAQRARLFRERRKQRQIGVTEGGISRQIDVTYNATSRYEGAGREPVVAERASRGEQVMREYLGGPVQWETGLPAGEQDQAS